MTRAVRKRNRRNDVTLRLEVTTEWKWSSHAINEIFRIFRSHLCCKRVGLSGKNEHFFYCIYITYHFQANKSRVLKLDNLFFFWVMKNYRETKFSTEELNVLYFISKKDLYIFLNQIKNMRHLLNKISYNYVLQI